MANELGDQFVLYGEIIFFFPKVGQFPELVIYKVANAQPITRCCLMTCFFFLLIHLAITPLLRLYLGIFGPWFQPGYQNGTFKDG